jgi:phosphoribosylanthranilate isomerase
MSLKIKVCGMKFHENIMQLVDLKPDYIGFIFYKASKRFVGENFNFSEIKNIPPEIKKVGVFVNSSKNYIFEQKEKYKLDFIQLHGNESPEFCNELSKYGLHLIKAFQIDNEFDLSMCKSFESSVQFFLFDTKTSNFGGSGQNFDWNLLEKYNLDTKFMLSGGIGLGNIEKINTFKHKKLFAIDLNSQFELEPAKKDIEKLKIFFQKVKN